MSETLAKKLGLMAVGCGLAWAASACGDKLEPGVECAGAPPQVRYAQVQPIFEAHCVSCHAEDSPDRESAPDNVNYDTYENSAQWAERGAVRAAGTMPPLRLDNPVSEADVCKLQAWFTGGVLE